MTKSTTATLQSILKCSRHTVSAAIPPGGNNTGKAPSLLSSSQDDSSKQMCCTDNDSDSSVSTGTRRGSPKLSSTDTASPTLTLPDRGRDKLQRSHSFTYCHDPTPRLLSSCPKRHSSSKLLVLDDAETTTTTTTEDAVKKEVDSGSPRVVRRHRRPDRSTSVEKRSRSRSSSSSSTSSLLRKTARAARRSIRKEVHRVRVPAASSALSDDESSQHVSHSRRRNHCTESGNNNCRGALIRSLSGSNLRKLFCLDSDVWNDAHQTRAEQLVSQQLLDQTEKLSTLATLLCHAQALLAARAESKNKVGLIVSLKQVWKHQVEQTTVRERIVLLQKLRDDVRSGVCTPLEFPERIQNIMDHVGEPATSNAEDVEVLTSKNSSDHHMGDSFDMHDLQSMLELASEFCNVSSITTTATTATDFSNQTNIVASSSSE